MNHGVWLRCGDGVGVTDLVDLAVEAEDAGWDGVFVSDSLPFAQYPDPWVVLAAMAARTERVTLGTWVVPAPRYEPWALANAVASLDRLSGGRVLLGVGLGNDDDYVAYGRPYEPPALGARLDETLEVLVELWSGDPVTYDGEHFTLEEATVAPTPVQTPRVPILAGAWWPNKKPFHRGARWDGIVPWFVSFGGGEGPRGERADGTPREEIRAALEYYRDVADDPGTVVLPIPPGTDVSAHVDEWADLGATWLLRLDLGDDPASIRERIRAGPP